jgi:hypothetical protein
VKGLGVAKAREAIESGWRCEVKKLRAASSILVGPPVGSNARKGVCELSPPCLVGAVGLQKEGRPVVPCDLA